MFKNIPSFMLAGALALPVAPAALGEYEEYCLNNKAGFATGFHIQIVKRGPSLGRAPERPLASKGFFTGRHGFTNPNTRCVTAAEAGVRPGDAIRFIMDPAGDIANKGRRVCGPHRDRTRGFEGMFLIPDGRPEGKLTFKATRGLYNGRCELEHPNTERMHSVCGATEDGMNIGGCNRFELDQKQELGTTGGRQLPRAAEMNASLGQFHDLVARGGYDLNQTLRNGATALHIAARNGRGDLVDILVRRGADLDARMDDGGTPLMEALLGRRFDMAEKLLVAGANPSLTREDGEFPLRYAAEQGPADIVELMLNSGALVNALHSETGQSALGAASGRQDSGRNAVMDLLRSYGAEDRVHVEVVPNLIATDAGLDALDEALAAGADVNEATGDNVTALHIAAQERFGGTYLDTLVDGDADINAQDDQGRTPLMVAIEAGNSSFAQGLLYYDGVDANLPRLDGNGSRRRGHGGRHPLPGL